MPNASTISIINLQSVTSPGASPVTLTEGAAQGDPDWFCPNPIVYTADPNNTDNHTVTINVPSMPEGTLYININIFADNSLPVQL
jgi:hypothetical protein